MTTRVTVHDVNRIDQLISNLEKLNGKKLKVGVFGDKRHDGSDIKMVDLARIHEFGCDIQVTPKMRAWFAYQGYPLKEETTVIHIPERSFLRSGFDENIDTLYRKVKELLPGLVKNQVDSDMFMNAIGLEFAGLIQKKMGSIQSPKNSDMTIQRKGSSNPLQDSGHLVDSIRHEVSR